MLIDGVGGFATAAMLCGVLRAFHETVGLPPETLTVLGGVGAAYGVYSMACACFVKQRWGAALSLIAGANLLYCVLSAYVVFANRRAVTPLGVAYFAVEIVVIVALVSVELAAARAHVLRG
jgi:hypothetical protein